MKELKKLLEEKAEKEIWETYCGFLDLSMEQYTQVQEHLLMEQVTAYARTALGRKFFGEQIPLTVEEFRQKVPLTQYEDYAEDLLKEDDSVLSVPAELWVQTTWEGGLRPVKKAPYNRKMLDVFRNRVVACMLLSTSKGKGDFSAENGDKMLYGLAPLPFVTGLLPAMLDEALDIEILPPVKEAVQMSFSERNKRGFQLAMQQGVDYFFGLASVLYKVSKSLPAVTGKEGLKPKHLFHLKSLLVAGTDNRCYKDDLEELWGVQPFELFAGTEPSVVGTENWKRNGLYFFPDTCFYEFIRKEDTYRSLQEKDFIPPTRRIHEVVPGEEYELVITVLHGGAFVRYRIGDMFRCVALGDKEEGISIPRFEYVDRRPEVIDLAGFTRITENEMEVIMEESAVKAEHWTVLKDYASNQHPFLHLYVEPANGESADEAELKHKIDTAFRKVDADYADLQGLLGMDPLKVTILPERTFQCYKNRYQKEFPKFQPDMALLGKLNFDRI